MKKINKSINVQENDTLDFSIDFEKGYFQINLNKNNKFMLCVDK